MNSEARLFFADLDEASERVSAGVATMLPREEREAASRLRFPRGARRFIAARLFLREVLGRMLGTDPFGIRFEFGPHGKPAVASPKGTSLSFNLSHADGRVLLAVAWHRRIGVDLEPWNAAPDADALAASVLAPVELDQFRRLGPDQRRRFFLERWTAKEALLKASGIGFGADPSRILLVPDGADGYLGDAGDLGVFRVGKLRELPGFAAAVATDAAVPLSAARMEFFGSKEDRGDA